MIIDADEFKAEVEASGLSMSQIFEASGLHHSFFYRWRDGRKVTLDTVKKFNAALVELRPKEVAA